MAEPSPNTSVRKRAAADDAKRAVKLWGYGLDCVTIGERLTRSPSWVADTLTKAGVRTKGERRDRYYGSPTTYDTAWDGHVAARHVP